MRVRLLLDVELSSEDIHDLQEIIDKQPDALVKVADGKPLGARLMGATPVEEGG